MPLRDAGPCHRVRAGKVAATSRRSQSQATWINERLQRPFANTFYAMRDDGEPSGDGKMEMIYEKATRFRRRYEAQLEKKIPVSIMGLVNCILSSDASAATIK